MNNSVAIQMYEEAPIKYMYLVQSLCEEADESFKASLIQAAFNATRKIFLSL